MKLSLHVGHFDTARPSAVSWIHLEEYFIHVLWLPREPGT